MACGIAPPTSPGRHIMFEGSEPTADRRGLAAVAGRRRFDRCPFVLRLSIRRVLFPDDGRAEQV